MFVKRASNKLDSAHLTIAFLFGLNNATPLLLFLLRLLLLGLGCNTYQIMHALLLPSRNCPDPVDSNGSPLQLIYAIFVDANFPREEDYYSCWKLIQVLRKVRRMVINLLEALSLSENQLE